jgi:hypothetical protein
MNNKQTLNKEGQASKTGHVTGRYQCGEAEIKRLKEGEYS